MRTVARWAVAGDGTRIAYQATGGGEPVVIMILVVGALALFSPNTLRVLGDTPAEPAVTESSTAATPT